MKKLFLTYLFCNLYLFCTAQSYIGLSTGLDWAQIREVEDIKPSFQEFYVQNQGFSTRSAFFSISGEHHLTKKASICLNLSYTKKDFPVYMENFIEILGIRYTSYKGALLLKWSFNDYIYFSSGLSMNWITNLRNYFVNGIEEQVYINNYKKYGLPLILGFKYKNFFIEPYYLQGFWLFKNSKKDKQVDIRPINALGVSVGYLIRVSKNKNTVYGF